jgi:hypothetical protein
MKKKEVTIPATDSIATDRAPQHNFQELFQLRSEKAPVVAPLAVKRVHD